MINLNDQGQVFPSANQVQSDNGGQAFPMCMPTAAGTGVVYGMTLRDYFAAKAMQAIITKYGNEPPYLEEDELPDAESARWSYEMADAMLRARGEA